MDVYGDCGVDSYVRRAFGEGFVVAWMWLRGCGGVDVVAWMWVIEGWDGGVTRCACRGGENEYKWKWKWVGDVRAGFD
jgi:hypothetical protein